MSTAAPTWAAVLDSMERRLTLAGRTLAGDGDVHIDHLALPPGLGPLPAALAPRARALLRATREAEAQAEAQMADLAERLRRTTSAARPVGLGGSGSDRPEPRYFDRSA